ncbi:hypothetical protein BDB01DRAFT_851125 [Pilobolus umbonatus]|nr:hypothetical protein BDB01DRAFT_851125 [Pilobolus umbonatus]
MSAFWGKRMVPGEACPLFKNDRIILNMVSLDSNKKKGKSILKVDIGGKVYMLCTLRRDKVEQQTLSHLFVASDGAILKLEGSLPVTLIGEQYTKEKETVSGHPHYPNYLSDLLGPDLPDEDDADYEEDSEEEEEGDAYGSLAFRDPSDNRYLGGFQLHHFNIEPQPQIRGIEKLNLRKEEKTLEDTLLK